MRICYILWCYGLCIPFWICIICQDISTHWRIPFCIHIVLIGWCCIGCSCRIYWYYNKCCITFTWTLIITSSIHDCICTYKCWIRCIGQCSICIHNYGSIIRLICYGWITQRTTWSIITSIIAQYIQCCWHVLQCRHHIWIYWWTGCNNSWIRYRYFQQLGWTVTRLAWGTYWYLIFIFSRGTAYKCITSCWTHHRYTSTWITWIWNWIAICCTYWYIIIGTYVSTYRYIYQSTGYIWIGVELFFRPSVWTYLIITDSVYSIWISRWCQIHTKSILRICCKRITAYFISNGNISYSTI